MRTRSGAALLVMASAFLILGLISLSWELISLLIPLALLLYLTFLLNRPPVMDLRFSRELESERLQEGEVVEVTLRIHNQGEALDYLEVMDSLPPGAEVVEGRERFPLSLPDGGAAEVRYKARFGRRGSYQFGGIRARWADPTLMESREVCIPGQSRVLVLPQVQDLRRCGLRPSRLRAQAGNVPSAALGPGLEFFCLRDYQDGDELRRINWKASARRERLQVNQLESERSGDVVIMVDARSGLFDQGARARMVDLEVDAATSLASYLLKERHRVGLMVLGDTMEVVPMGLGKRHFYRLVDRLLAARAGQLRSTQSLDMAMGRYFPHSSTVLAISPLEDRRIEHSLTGLGMRGHHVLLLSLDTFPMEVGLEASPEAQEAAERLHRVRRVDLLAEMARHCQVIDWDPRVPLFRYFMEGRASPGRAR